MAGGYTGRILRVNLTQGTIGVETPDELWYRAYFGGTGLIAYYLMKELAPGVEPLGPENKLIFAAGPLTGVPAAGTGRNSLGAKSPLTGGIGFSEAGGFWGAELKRAGFDAIIIEGRAPRPSYLAIIDGQVEIRDATALAGRMAHEVQEAIRTEVGDRSTRVAQCGPAGENLVRCASVVNDLKHFYGRAGLGAVMGSKNLRAVAVRGHSAVPVVDQARVTELARFMVEKWPELAGGLGQNGTAATVMALNAAGGLPTRNFAHGVFEGAEAISAQRMNETILTDRESCFACPIRCKRVVRATSPPWDVDPVYGGPEYETLAALGSNCGVSDLTAVAKANELCGAYVLDTIGTGMCIAFAMECFERGLLTSADTGGLDLRFGNAPAMVEMVSRIARREGLGDLLAEGTARAAARLGGDAARLTLHVKGQEAPMHDPRLKHGLGLGYAVSPTGADHCHNIHDTIYAKRIEGARPWGILRTVPETDLGPDKIRLLRPIMLWRHFANCAALCMFVPWTPGQVVDLVNAATGWDTSLYELTMVAERAHVLARLFNLREGFTGDDDRLPARFFVPFTDGPIAGVAPSPEGFDQARRAFYEASGWHRDSGVPERWKLEELDLAWADPPTGAR
jgi:aldehyde:ferredoxin oxidoreductase